MIGLIFKLFNHFYPLKYWDGGGGEGTTETRCHMPILNRDYFLALMVHLSIIQFHKSLLPYKCNHLLKLP